MPHSKPSDHPLVAMIFSSCDDFNNKIQQKAQHNTKHGTDHIYFLVHIFSHLLSLGSLGVNMFLNIKTNIFNKEIDYFSAKLANANKLTHLKAKVEQKKIMKKD